MSITVVNSVAQLNSLTTNPAAVSVIDFHAVWCGPCKAIAPVYQKLAGQYAGRVQFLKVDVDQVPDVAQKFNVKAMPTFAVLRGSAKVDEMAGANPAGLSALIAKHAPAAGAGASASGSGSQDKGLEGFVSLNSEIDQSQVHCLNESAEHPLKDMLRGGDDKWLESDADEQLLLHIPIQQSIKLRALRFTTNSSHAKHAPRTIKVYVNNPGVDFDAAEGGGAEAAQEIVLDEEQARGKKVVELRFVRFQNVKHLSIFVADNQSGGDEDVTRIDSLELVGLAVEGTNMSDLKKLEDE
ncbi:thioredoxin [Rhodotorula taiwanensis]|uniref:Thioredoxin n=1 Tax=Rhodotorula taiwanensis TaxID=741276 RepID=A0A2S5B710_9BASI|nr:thioredoxin [Rhodotorula taiwanensis]